MGPRCGGRVVPAALEIRRLFVLSVRNCNRLRCARSMTPREKGDYLLLIRHLVVYDVTRHDADGSRLQWHGRRAECRPAGPGKHEDSEDGAQKTTQAPRHQGRHHGEPAVIRLAQAR